jgi:hypothetical protein
VTTSRLWLGISAPLWLKKSDTPQDLLPAAPLFRGQPATIGIPHTTGIPHDTPAVTRRNPRN